ncbi:Metallo-hydrolase/oxidoreductase [Amylocystis lapponica]|nr:Metallo-hydrolase/oxidoreductase [Amylocystis lapponica]
MSYPLPPPVEDQAYCDISALEGGKVKVPLAMILDTASGDDMGDFPSLAFLLRHSSKPDTFIFDLGIPCKWQELPPAMVAGIHRAFAVDVSPSTDVIASLRKGGLDPADVTHVCLSHVHWDHAGDPSAFTSATFCVGAGARALLADGFPPNSASVFQSALLPPARTRFLVPDTDAGWAPLGSFPRALDFYGDGSLYLVDTPGHLPGHLAVLARTSCDGAWVFLAGDAAHDWRLLRGEAQIAQHGAWGCIHRDAATAAETIAYIAALAKVPRVRVLLAHDVPWYAANEGGGAFWPGKIKSL